MSKQTIDLKKILENKIAELDLEPSEITKKNIDIANRQIPTNLFYEAGAGEFVPETVSSDFGTIRPLSIQEAKEFQAKIDDCIEQIFQEGVHYGRVTGIAKRFLFKAGGEVLTTLLGMTVRCEIQDKVEDYNNGFFSFTCKTWLIDGTGIVRAEGLGSCNSRENKYVKSSPYNVVNILIKIAKKRSFIDAVLGVANLSNRFSQDEDLVESVSDGRNVAEVKKTKEPRLATKKQIAFIERLMSESGTSAEALNKYIKQKYDVDDYHYASSLVISELIEKFQSAK